MEFEILYLIKNNENHPYIKYILSDDISLLDDHEITIITKKLKNILENGIIPDPPKIETPVKKIYMLLDMIDNDDLS